MNRVFRIVWSTALNAWVVASELAGKHGKGRGRASAMSCDERSTRFAPAGWTLRLGLLAALSALYAYAPTALSTDLYWDVNGGAAGNGGSANWGADPVPPTDQTYPRYWNTSSDGISGPFVYWTNAPFNNAIFTGTAGTVTLETPINAQNLTFSTTGFTLGSKDASDILTLGGTTPTISVTTGTATINAVIAGNQGLTKAGAGELALGSGNTFTGGVNLTAGMLTIADDTSLGAAGNGVTLAAGTSLNVTGTLAATRVMTLTGPGAVTLFGANAGAARYTGAGGISVRSGVTMSNAASNFTGQFGFIGGGTYAFSSVGNLGQASSLGAQTDAAAGVILVQAGGGLGGTVNYTGTGSTSNRDWQFQNTSSGGTNLRNVGTGALILTGNISSTNAFTPAANFQAVSGDMSLTGVISSASTQTFGYGGSAGRTITLGGANTYQGSSTISAIKVVASVLADTGTASSFGTGTAGGMNMSAGTLSYTGGAASSNRTFLLDGVDTINNDGTGALALSGAATYLNGSLTNDTLTLGGSYTGSNTFSGAITTAGSVAMNGAGSWELDGANTYTGTTTVQSGTLIAGTNQAFSKTSAVIVNGGTLNLNNQSITVPSLAGTGGTVALGSGTLTLKPTSGSTSYAGSITGSGGLTKLGAGTQTLSGASTYTGATTIGGGTLALNFAAAGAPASNIIASGSALNLNGGTLTVTGAAAANSQSFSGLNITAGSNRINATAGSGGLTLGLGAINRSGGLVEFDFNTGSTITTTNADGALGGWATVNGTDYAQVTGGVIGAFTDYADKDDASTWVNGDIVSDEGGAANTPFTNTVSGNVALGGLKYTAAASSTVTVGAANTLSVDGSIIVSPTVIGTEKIQGGSLTGGAGGSPLGVLQNSAGNFTIASTIVDNGGATSFVSGGSGTGVVTLTGNNTYTGSTTISGGTLVVSNLGSGGTTSAIGASTSDSANLVLENGTLHYTGAGTQLTDRGFTLVNGGPSRTIQVDGTAVLGFSGQVTSPDDAGFTKTGTGTLALSNPNNDFVGPVTVAGGTIRVNVLADGGQPSALGAGSSDPSSLVLQGGGTLQYSGVSDTIDRGFTLAGGVGDINVSNATTTLTDTGTLIGTGSLTKDGAGTLVLGGANTYTGGTTVNAGVLQAGSPQAFGGTATGLGAGQITVNAGGTVDLAGQSVFVGGINGAGAITLGTGTLQINRSGTFSGGISGTGGITLSGGANQTLTGCGSSYTGPTVLNVASITTDCLANGGVNSAIGAAASTPSNLAITNGNLFYTGATTSTDRGMLLAGTGNIGVNNAATVLTMSGQITGAGALSKSGDGTLVISGTTNTYTNGTVVSAGTLEAGAINAFSTGNMTLANVAGAQLDLDGFNTSVNILLTSPNAPPTTPVGGNIDLGGATLTVTNGASSAAVGNFNGAITGTGNFVKTGGAIEYLSGTASTYVGVTTVNAGALSVSSLANGGAASSIGASSNAAANLVLNGGTLQYLGSGSSTDRLFSLGAAASKLDASGTGAVQFTNTGAINFLAPNTAQTVTLTGTSALAIDNSLAAQISDNGTGKTTLSKTGTNTWILRNAASTYTGITNITGGVLGVDHLTNGGQASSIGSSSSAAGNLVIGSGATLRYTGTGDTTDRLFTLAAGSSVIESSGTGAIVFANTGSAAYAGVGNRTLGLGGTNTGNNTMGGTIIDASATTTTSLAKNDAGTWMLTGTNTYTGNTVVNAGLLELGNGGTSGSITSGSVIVDTAGTLGFNRSDISTMVSTISGAGQVAQLGTGLTALTAANTYTGGTTISAGILQLGNGGTTGSIMGDVTDNGNFAFNRSDVYTFGGLISGTGGINQAGTGTTILTGANSYIGGTVVSKGTLLIDGNQTLSTSGTLVQPTGTLGGTGIIGGNVTVFGGLNPGDTGAVGTLTINGNLIMNTAGSLNYQFGAHDVVGGTLNDLTVVHGNLTLDGTLNVTTTPGGNFGPGLYRVINYDGTLNNQGLVLGSVPASTYVVQTSVAGQVNLINTAGLTLNVWDGPNGHDNSTIDGGDGVWQASGGNANWTDPTGVVDAPYTDGAFSIFMGTPGTVTVDNTLGNVTSAGMQFAVDGYTVNGSAITLASGQDVIKVGDGAADGAGMTATISAGITGAGTLVKEDLGTLVLAGGNTYTGGTAIDAGTLQISSDANLGGAASDLTIDGATLRNTAIVGTARDVTIGPDGATFDTQADIDITGDIDGAGGLTKTGAGTLTLDGNNSYGGGTAVNGGTVSIFSDGNLGITTTGLSLNGGTLQTTAVISSNRTVTLGSGGGSFNTFNDLTLTGAIGGAGALTKNDVAKLVLTANNTYAGGTTISGGVLQLGNGGTTGSVTGNIADNSTLVFDRSDSNTFAGLISGSGVVDQQGGGTTVLTGNNTYTGATNVLAGSLIVNGDQSAAVGDTTVDGGATLGGKGTIGGNVNVADGAALSPGDAGAAPGTLTINGNLALSNASGLDVNMGQANVVGGPLNDLVQVGGDLTLDGTLNVSVSSGGSFDPGIYRLISYGGNLTDNGLNIGSVPSVNYELQTAIANEVNLVNTNGLPVNFWDGPGTANDGTVQGGNGLWQNDPSNTNWTLVDGSVNAPYQDSSFSIFAAAPGTVTVDASLGAINSSGMQFATDGYRIEGDSIALTGTPVIRVGDGTTAGAGMTATIASVLTGSDGMTKTDLGTLVLAGDNTYTGGTTITDGTLQLGEGGTSGSVIGNVVDNGTLAFDRSDVNTIAGAISGIGAVMQIGSGTTVLTGANNYTGATTVQGGTLLVNGDDSAATGATTVQSGGTLGGVGTIGGSVTVADGATLSPGAVAGAAGTLTIDGNLALGANSTLDYQLGQAGTPGGASNDLTVVHGNLTLDGTLNVTATPGGTFGPGVYRIFSYDGTLTDNGLTLGSVPATGAFVQTSLANQVNLVDADGLTLSFWDGPGHENDGAITGGTGTWRLTDNDYWTEASGSINAPYSNGSFAVFGGTGGTVTVDNSNGQVSASGMQFSVDGYHLTGGEIALAGSASSIRVGDGTAAGAAMTATIDNVLSGSSMLVKDDLGTLVLNGANTYTGGTDVHAGTLQVANDGNLGQAAGNLSIDDATLHTTASFQTARTVGLGGAATIDTDDGTTLTVSNGIGGTGSLTKDGTGTLVLGGSSSYSGDTTVGAGTLRAAMADAFSATSAVTVQNGSTLDLAGFSQHVSDLSNAGTVNFGSTPGTTLTVAGNYAGQGGTLNFNTALGGDSSATDMLVVTGDTSGNTNVHVTNVGGAGAATTQGIKLIDVQGASNGTFALQGDYVFQGQQAVIAGAYAYRLYQNGTNNTDGDWYLRSALTNPPSDPGDPGNGNNPPPPTAPLYQPGVPLYEAYAGILQQANTMDTLAQRTGDRQWTSGNASGDMQPGEGVWVRTQSANQTTKPDYSTSGTRYDTSDWKSEVGIDATLNESGAGKLVGGASLQYDRDNANVHSAYGDGRITSHGYGIGASLTWYADNGFYVDGQAHWLSFNSDLRSYTLSRMLADGNDADGYAVSAEAGQRFHLSDTWAIVPQAQVTYGKTSFDGFDDVYGTDVRQQNGNTGIARAGVTLDYLRTQSGSGGAVTTHFYAIANVYNNFQNSAETSVAGTDFTTRDDRWWGGLGVGGAIDWAGGRYSVYGEIQAQHGFAGGNSHAMNGTVGFRMKW